MISTTKKRIVFVGEYTDWTSRWMYFDDENNSSLNRREFGSYKHEHHEDGKIERFCRFVDTSEFVVRFSKLRTLSGTQKNRFSYGRKTDALVVEGKVLNRDSLYKDYNKSFGGSEAFDSISKYGTNPFHLGYEDENFNLEVERGIIPIRSYNDSENYSYSNNNCEVSQMEITTKHLYDRLCGRVIACSYNPEIWFPLGRIFTSFSKMMFECICGLETPTFHANRIVRDTSDIIKDLKELFSTLRRSTSKYSEHLGLNGKMVDLHSYLDLRSLIDSYYESYEELNNKFNGKQWWHDMLEKGEQRLEAYGKEHLNKSPYYLEDPSKFTFHDAFEISRSAMNINRGTEALWMAMNDERFKDYDFYIIGYYGLNQQFITPYLGDYLTEYQMLSDWIKSGRIKYLPEHIDELNSEYSSSLKKEKYTVYFE